MGREGKGRKGREDRRGEGEGGEGTGRRAPPIFYCTPPPQFQFSRNCLILLQVRRRVEAAELP